jgi:hypothetical protein
MVYGIVLFDTTNVKLLFLFSSPDENSAQSPSLEASSLLLRADNTTFNERVEHEFAKRKHNTGKK